MNHPKDTKLKQKTFERDEFLPLSTNIDYVVNKFF
jgi:hypothetical protein